MTAEKRTLYSILQVTEDADAEVVAAAFQSCKKRLHAKVAAGDEN